MASPSSRPDLPAPSASEGLDGLFCEWCGAPAKLRIPKMKKIRGKSFGKVPTGTSFIVCHAHEDVARTNALNDG